MDRALPDGIEPRHLAAGTQIWAGLPPILVLGAFVLAALLGPLGGGRGDARTAESADARLTVESPVVMRQGVLFETWILVEPRRPLRDLQVALSPDLWRNFTINTMTPEPSEAKYQDGLFRLSFGAADAGRPLEFKFDGQINPSLELPMLNAGEIAVFDGETRLVSLPLRIRVLP